MTAHVRVDPEAREFFAQNMGLTFPSAATGPGRRLLSPIMVYREPVPALSVDALGAYCVLADWAKEGEELSLDRLASRIGDVDRARAATAELFTMGMLLTPEESEQRARAWEELQARRNEEARAARVNRPKLSAPDPWPEFQEGAWSGVRDPFSWKSCPGRGVPVVYWLYGDDGTLLYVGSTGNAGSRLLGHGDKPWVRYEARECPDRDMAYWLEAAEIANQKPTLNRDRSLNGKCALAPKARRRRRRTVPIGGER